MFAALRSMSELSTLPERLDVAGALEVTAMVAVPALPAASRRHRDRVDARDERCSQRSNCPFHSHHRLHAVRGVAPSLATLDVVRGGSR